VERDTKRDISYLVADTEEAIASTASNIGLSCCMSGTGRVGSLDRPIGVSSHIDPRKAPFKDVVTWRRPPRALR